MLDQLRRGAGSWAAKILIALLVVAFAVWGVADIFTGYTDDVVAEVGSEGVPLARFEADFNARLRDLSRQLGQPLTPAQGRQYGIDRQVMAGLIGSTALNVKAGELGFAVSDEAVATDIATDPELQGPFGRVDPQTVRQLLQQSGITEAEFIEDRRHYLVRDQLLDGVKTGVRAPRAIVEAIYRYQYERRVPRYLVLPPNAVGEIEDPEESVIADYHRQTASRFTRPETRSITVMVLNPEDLSDSIEIAEDELRAEHEARRARYDTPELRTVDQIAFANMADARGAIERLRQGANFSDVVSAQGLTLADVALGEVSRSDFLSSEIADAAFALGEGEISAPIDGPLGPVVVRVTGIKPGEMSRFDDIRAELSQTLQEERARDEVFDVQNAIEDDRAGGGTLEEIARKYDLRLIEVTDVNAQGLDAAGRRPASLPDIPGLVELAFDTDVGQELDPGDTEQDGYYWLRVDGVTPAELKPLDEVRDDVLALWKRETRTARLGELAATIVERADGGESLDAIADSYGRATLTGPALDRRASDETFSRTAVTNLFATPEGKHTAGPVGFGDSVVVMRVERIQAVDPAANPETVARLTEDISDAMQSDMVSALVGGLQEQLGVRINSRLVERMFVSPDGQGGASF